MQWRRALGAGAITVLGASSSAGLEGPGWQARQSSHDGLPRTVTVSFGEIEAVWSADDCHLVGVWRGSQLLARAAPQQPLWLLRIETLESELQAELKGYRRSGNDLILDCKLRPADGGEVWIEELPSLIHSEAGTPGLRRTFRSYGVPAGHRVWTDISIAPMPSRRDLSSNGDLRTRDRQRIRRMLRKASRTEAELGLVSNGITRLDAYFAPGVEPLAPPATALDEREVSKSDPLRSQHDDSVGDPVDEGEVAFRQGLSMRIWDIGQPMRGLFALDPSLRPNVATVIPTVDLDEAGDFGGPRDRFRTTVSGLLAIGEPGTYELRLTADDGAALWIDDRPLIEYQGGFTRRSTSASLDLRPGLHPIRIEHFDNLGGQVLRLEWKPPSATELAIIPLEALRSVAEFQLTAPGTKAIADVSFNRAPGNGLPPAGLHPAYSARQITVDSLPGSLVHLTLDSKERLVVAERGGQGRIFAVEGLFAEPPNPTVRQLAAGLREPLAVRSVGRQIFVLQNRELLQLVDVTGDGVIDEHWTFATGWLVPEGTPRHGRLRYRDDTFTLRLGPVDLAPTSAESLLLEVTSEGNWQQIPGLAHDREILALGPGTARRPFAATIPARKQGAAARIVHGADLKLFGYEGQSVIALDNGSLARVVPEEVDGQLQAVIIPFAKLAAAGAVQQILATRSGKLLVSHKPGSVSPGLVRRTFTRLDPNDDAPFEIAAVRAKANGIEIELTESLGGRAGWDPADYLLRQYLWEAEDEIESQRLFARSQLLPVHSASVSTDRRRIFLETPSLEPRSLIHVRLQGPFVGESGQRPWSAEAWYSLLSVVEDRGEVRLGPILTSPNTLTESERANRWRLLFDGESLKGWRGFRRPDAPSAWRVGDGLLTLGSEGERGDLISERQYSDFELVLEWAVAPGGNSGILYRVSESADASHWTGPEYQILDEKTGDGRAPHSTGANYALYAPRYPAARGPLRFNETRIVVSDGRVEHWLNGYLVVQYELGSGGWQERVRKSKFADRKGYGRQQRGHLGLQDHGDEVWFRSIKLREL